MGHRISKIFRESRLSSLRNCLNEFGVDTNGEGNSVYDDEI